MERYKVKDFAPPIKMLYLDGEDKILQHWAYRTGATLIDRKDISSKITESPWPNDIPVSFRSMTKRKEIWKCWETGRPFYYLDNGYMGNLMKRKEYYRIVKNNIQHTKPKQMPKDRFDSLCEFAPYMRYTGKRPLKKQNGAILLVTHSEKPCMFYKIDRDQWVQETVAELKKHTDRPIIVRDKGLRPERIKDNSVAGQCKRQGIYAVVTYQSMAALEAIHFGIPAFTMAPSCTDTVANRDLSLIETPKYPDEEEFQNLLNFLAYCQYTCDEMRTGIAFRNIEKFELYD